ncbi:MAG: hypothetical protein LBQ23_01220 [Puniceicoccales bacterium]|nr:hypothetical protein [Puniceicoccales bacterium]
MEEGTPTIETTGTNPTDLTTGSRSAPGMQPGTPSDKLRTDSSPGAKIGKILV